MNFRTRESGGAVVVLERVCLDTEVPPLTKTPGGLDQLFTPHGKSHLRHSAMLTSLRLSPFELVSPRRYANSPAPFVPSGRVMSLWLLKFSGGSVDDYAICRSSCL